jgi:hypothetical protein
MPKQVEREWLTYVQTMAIKDHQALDEIKTVFYDGVDAGLCMLFKIVKHRIKKRRYEDVISEFNELMFEIDKYLDGIK